MGRSRIQIAKADIIRYFDQLPEKVHKYSDIARVLSEQRAFWRLTQKMSTRALITFLLDHGKLRVIEYPFPYRHEVRYLWGDVSHLVATLTLRPNCYFCHYTAVRAHGLTEQWPKTTYLNYEQPAKHRPDTELVQNRIDAAFRAPVRVSSNVAEVGDQRICLLNGMQTKSLGVISIDVIDDRGIPARNIRVTGIERTLIDISVRPIYAGGVFEVLKAYRLAQGQASVNRLAALLRKLGCVYPYHQAVGFYLDRAGYKASSLDLLRQFPMEFDFYLTHAMAETEYIKEWRLYVPKGLQSRA